jgi:hypothetical protein
MLHSIADARKKISSGRPLLLAGSGSVLAQLPRGKWIAGSIPYFMDVSGGVCSQSQVFVTELAPFVSSAEVREYSAANIPFICRDAPQNGFSVLIMSYGSAVHAAYAKDAPTYSGMFLKPVVGWVAGVHLDRLGKDQPQVFNGVTGRGSFDSAVVMHVTLPHGKLAELDIVNVFKPGSGPIYTFPSSGLDAKDCLVDGKPVNLAEHMASTRQDTRLPLTADYNGSIVNVGIQKIDESTGTVSFYGPVFVGVEYRFALPVSDYVRDFQAAVRHPETPTVFACNCLLNYLYAGLEGKRTGVITGPISFGEIANQLLTQTMVRLLIRDSG